MLNLAVNSRDAMPAGGRLTITTSLEETGEPEPASGLVVRLQVTDTGSGIPSAVISRIFEPFFTTKDVGKGTGLGLATVYAIVRQHGGTIDVHSEAGQGTTFDIVFPAQRFVLADERSARRVEMPRGYETILVVEDEPAVRHLVEHLLRQNGYRVVAAESGQRALAIFAEHGDKIDLLLTDMVMPDGVSGRQLAQQLMAQRPDLKVIYTSGYTADAVVPDVSLIPGENFLAKPYPPADLARLVRAALDR